MKIISLLLLAVASGIGYVAWEYRVDLVDTQQEVKELEDSLRYSRDDTQFMKYCLSEAEQLYGELSEFYDIAVTAYNNDVYLGQYVEGYVGSAIDNHNTRLEQYNNSCYVGDNSQLQ